MFTYVVICEVFSSERVDVSRKHRPERTTQTVYGTTPVGCRGGRWYFEGRYDFLFCVRNLKDLKDDWLAKVLELPRRYILRRILLTMNNIPCKDT